MVQKTKKEFNWDKYFSKYHFEADKINAIFPHVHSNPSAYNHDRTLFYASSLDLAFETDNAEELLFAMLNTKDYFDSLKDSSAYYKMAKCKDDFETAQALLCDIYPDHMWSAIEEYMP